MAQSRIEIFAEMVKQQPEDAMIWYGLGSEYMKAEMWREAIDALRPVLILNPDYTAAFQMLGTALMNEGRVTEARDIWKLGVETARRTGAWKAQQHMEGLLASTNDATPGAEFCE